MSEIGTILHAEIEHIELDDAVLVKVREQPVEIRDVALRLGVSWLKVAAALGRLGRRRLLDPSDQPGNTRANGSGPYYRRRLGQAASRAIPP